MIRRALSFALVAALTFPLTVGAAESLTVSVTPPLFQLSMGAGEYWASTLKVVNTNAYDVDYYTTVVNFEPAGERGSSSFKPVADDFGSEHDRGTLASWIKVTTEPIPVPAGQSVDVPFTVQVPNDAPPGGHYAAILVGTQPPNVTGTGPQVSVASYVSTLFFVKLRGDVIEEGRIRQFSSERDLYDTTDVTFNVRFENTGTVHVRPVGDIRVFNMWGKERGVIPINQGTTFGNVLPKSIRRYDFKWSGEFSPFEIGRYKAVLTLGYGSDVVRTTSAVTYFWVVPVVPVATTLAVVLLFIFSTVFFIRRYIRKVLRAEQSRLGVVVSEEAPARARTKNRSEHTHIGGYRIMFALAIYIVVSVAVFAWYFGEALVDTRTYTATELTQETLDNPTIPEND